MKSEQGITEAQVPVSLSAMLAALYRDVAARPALAGALLVAMALVAYLPVVRDQFIWDDEQYVLKNPTLTSAEGLWHIWFNPQSLPQYYPLVHTTYWIEYHLWGYAPLGYHLVNLFLHATSAVLVWRLFLRWGIPGAWLAGAIFAVHPVHVESVAWVTERKNVLSGALVLSSFLAYLRFFPLDDEKVPSNIGRGRRQAPAGPWEVLAAAFSKRWPWYVLSLAVFAAALFSKTVVASMPAVVLVVYWWKRGSAQPDAKWTITAQRWLAAIAPLVPFFVLGAWLAKQTVWMEVNHVNARGPEWDFTRYDRLLIAGRAVWFYASKLVCPHPLIFFYPRWKLDPHVWWQWMFPAAAVAALVALWLLRKRIGRGPLAAVLVFVGVLVPALGFFDVYPFRYSFVADHFQYHASLGLIALGAAGVALAARRLGEPAALVYVVAGVLGILAALTFRQTFIYHDLETLYNDIIAKNPGGWTAYSNLSAYLATHGRHKESLPLARRACEIDPTKPTVQNNLGHILLKMGERYGFEEGQLAEAAEHFRETVRIDPELWEARKGLGSVAMIEKDAHAAYDHFTAAMAGNPNDAEVLFGMGWSLAAMDRIGEARHYVEKSLERAPNFPAAHHQLALILIKQGSLDAAIEHLHAALKYEANNPETHWVLGNTLLAQEKLEAAAEAYREAIRLKPEYAYALNSLGTVLARQGDLDQAIEMFNRALEADPDAADAQANLEKARQLQQQSEQE
ncbi:MAG: tetratricopeptide repeat protein [Planctomycetia bacterium]|nr:tetratricopeptide repeat protein [Planctomycetia bacterium]